MMRRNRRRSKVIINGLEDLERDSELDEDKIKRWLEKKLAINIRTERMWKIKGKLSPIGIVCCWRDKEEIMKNKHGLADTRICIDQNLTWDERII